MILAAACAVAPRNTVPTTPQPVRPEIAGRATERAQSAEERAETARRFRVAVDAYSDPSVALNADSDQDTEPTITALNVGGSDRTAVAFIKITPVQLTDPEPFRAVIQTTSTTNLTVFPGPTAVTHPTPGLTGVNAYLNSADPYLAANNINAGSGALRTYLVGLAYNMSNKQGLHSNGGVVVWRSDNGGSTWSASKIVAEVAQPRVVDKPHIAVSWNTASYDGHGPTVGNVYVTWVDVNQNAQTTDSRIMFSSSTDGGVNWSTPITLATGFVHAPQVVVPSNTGRVFVLYARYTSLINRTNAIEMTRSLDLGVNWTAQPTLTLARMFGPGRDQLNGGVYARSVFQARYNPWVGLQVIWHGEDPNSVNTTDIWYASYGGTWSRTNITPSAAGDQWNPSFDYDASGNAMVSWLDRRNDTSNLVYQPYYKKINTAGTELQAPAALDANTNDPASYTLSPSVGEYADTWFFNYAGGSRWVTVWPRISGAGNGNISSTVIVP